MNRLSGKSACPRPNRGMTLGSMAAIQPLIAATPPGGRVAFMDHFRWGVVALVVTIHAAVTYSGIGGWYYHEPAELGTGSLLFFLAYELHLQAFFMGLLFFVAGYFVPGAYDRKGAWRFLQDRAYRLGLPTLFYALVLQPFLEYSVRFHQGQPLPSLGEMYPRYVFGLGFLSGTGPMWFALALLVFTAIYTGIRAARGAGPWRPASTCLPTHAGVVSYIVVTAWVTFLVRVVQPVGTNVLNMQLCFFPQYIALFTLGLIAYRADWLRRIPRSFGLFWLRLACILGPFLWVGFLVAGRFWRGEFAPIAGGWHLPSALYCLWESFFCAGVCLGLIVLLRDGGNRHTRLTRLLSDNSFAVYVFHPPILLWLTIAFAGLAWPPIVKFALLSVVCLAICYPASHFVFRRLPGLRHIL